MKSKDRSFHVIYGQQVICLKLCTGFLNLIHNFLAVLEDDRIVQLDLCFSQCKVASRGPGRLAVAAVLVNLSVDIVPVFFLNVATVEAVGMAIYRLLHAVQPDPATPNAWLPRYSPNCSLYPSI